MCDYFPESPFRRRRAACRASRLWEDGVLPPGVRRVRRNRPRRCPDPRWAQPATPDALQTPGDRTPFPPMALAPADASGNRRPRSRTDLESRSEPADLSQSLETLTALTDRIGTIARDAAFGQTVREAEGLLAVTQIAKEYGLSGMRFNALLKELGVQYKMGNQWLLYARYAGKGYTRTVYSPIRHHNGSHSVLLLTKWTLRGRAFLGDLLAKRGIHPTGTVEATAEGMAGAAIPPEPSPAEPPAPPIARYTLPSGAPYPEGICP